MKESSEHACVLVPITGVMTEKKSSLRDIKSIISQDPFFLESLSKKKKMTNDGAAAGDDWADLIRVKRPVWRGQQFDSQLEADWAATFQSWGMEYVYHPGRMALSGGVVWEPDFQLDGDVVFEVKGEHNERLWKVEQAREELPSLAILVGRAGFIPGGMDTEVAGAVWEPEDWVLVYAGTHVAWMHESEIDGHDVYYSGHRACTNGLMGIRMFKAIDNDGVK